MTKVARLYEEKMLEAVELVTKRLKKEKEEAVRQLEEEKRDAVKRLEEEKKEVAKRLEDENHGAVLKLTAMKWIIKGCTPQEAARESGLSVEEVEELLK